MNVLISPKEALIGYLDLPEMGRVTLHFLITAESDALYIRCLDFGVMSWGESVAECKENIREAILIYLEDLPAGQSLFKPAPAPYWRMFYDLFSQKERRKRRKLSAPAKAALSARLRREGDLALRYA